ncbi:MAG: hypothetical protein QOC82_3583, partial [Frankiaceae bacterium]|nr:hypothetical protein [Frankiaceae bacterium]
HVAFTAALNDILLVGAVVAIAGGLLAFALVRASDFLGQGPPAAPVPEQQPTPAAASA